MRTCQLLAIVFASSLAFVPACGGGDDDGSDGDPAGEAPVISEVTWTFAEGCAANEASEVVIAITATDAETAAADLEFSGSVTGCTGSIDANPATLTCPNAATYNGTVTVTDMDGDSDMQGVTIMPCTDGSAP